MAKKTKTTTTTTQRRDTVTFCAFWGLAISAVLYVTSGLIKFITSLIKNLSPETASVLNKITGITSLLGSIAIVVAVALPAYGYVRGKKKGWKIFYWIALAVFVFGVVFGAIPTLL